MRATTSRPEEQYASHPDRALYFNMVPDSQRNACIDLLLNKAHIGLLNYNDGYSDTTDNTYHISTGIQGCGRELLELTRDGHTDSAYHVLTDLRFPSWLYNVTAGTAGVFKETTISERWNAYVTGAGGDRGYYPFGTDSSFNHYAFGCVGEWVWKYVVGINPDESNPGFANTIFTPTTGGDLSSASGWFNSIHGIISSAWLVSGTTNSYTVVVPANTTGLISIPSVDIAHIAEGSTAVTNATGVSYRGFTNGAALLDLGSGTFNFKSWH